MSGTDCNSLLARFNLTHCSYEKKDQVDAQVKCHGPNSATVTAETAHGKYDGSFELGEEIWGQRPWNKGPTHSQQKEVVDNSKKLTDSSQVKKLNSRINLNSESADATPGTASTALTPGIGHLPGGITITGLLDVYFAHNYAIPPIPSLTPSVNGGPFIVPKPQNTLHELDLYSDQFSLNMAEISILKDDGELRFRIDIDFGNITDYIHSAHTGSSTGGITGVDGVTKNIDQAVITYTPNAVHGLSFIAGKMPTFMGIEVLKTQENWNYSRSLLYAMANPYYHMGFGLGYVFVPNRLSTTLYLVNGWDQVYSINTSKTLGIQNTWTPSNEIVFNFNAIYGASQAGDNADMKGEVEINGVWLASRNWNFSFDAIGGWTNNDILPNGSRGNAYWAGASIDLKKRFGTKFYLSPRISLFSDPQGYTASQLPQFISELTLTASETIRTGFEVRLETRIDSSTAPVFPTGAVIGPYTQLVSLLGFLFSI